METYAQYAQPLLPLLAHFLLGVGVWVPWSLLAVFPPSFFSSFFFLYLIRELYSLKVDSANKKWEKKMTKAITLPAEIGGTESSPSLRRLSICVSVSVLMYISCVRFFSITSIVYMYLYNYRHLGWQKMKKEKKRLETYVLV